jgi:hypothetical protein
MARLVASVVTVAVLGTTCGVAAEERDLPGAIARPAVIAAPDASAAAAARLIDERLDAQLKAAGIPASAPATDAEFLRRVYLDLHGVVPAAQRVRSFLDDSSAEK